VASLPKVEIDLNPNPSHFKGDNFPVEQVSWIDAVEFCARLSQATGKTYRLPTEAEWEFACRAGTRGEYAGDDLDEMGWYDGNSAKTTHAVGRKKPNGFGLYDMHGNVLEWCRDWYSGNYYSQSPSVDPRGPGAGLDRVVRGGGWGSDAMNLRSAFRHGSTPDARSNALGFRLVKTYN
jgi:formylglycine-generating enzyme required for sulfatase activity